MLEGDHNPRGQSVGGAPKLNRLAPQGHLTGIRLNGPGNDVHQGRFAGSVFADNGVHGATNHAQACVIVRHYAVLRETLDYVGGCKQHVGTQSSGISR